MDAFVFLAALSLITFGVFGRMLRNIQQHGGKVRADILGFPELLISLVLTQIFVGLVVKGVWRAVHGPPPKIGLEQVLPSALFFVVLTVGLIGFLTYRGINVISTLGVDRLSPLRVLLLAFGLILAAYPGVYGSSVFLQLLSQKAVQEQELVVLFKQVASEENRVGVLQIFLAGAIIAPICRAFSCSRSVSPLPTRPPDHCSYR